MLVEEIVTGSMLFKARNYGLNTRILVDGVLYIVVNSSATSSKNNQAFIILIVCTVLLVIIGGLL